MRSSRPPRATAGRAACDRPARGRRRREVQFDPATFVDAVDRVAEPQRLQHHGCVARLLALPAVRRPADDAAGDAQAGSRNGRTGTYRGRNAKFTRFFCPGPWHRLGAAGGHSQETGRNPEDDGKELEDIEGMAAPVSTQTNA